MTMLSAQMPVGPGRTATATVVDTLVEAVRSHPDRTAIIHQERQLTYGELGRAVAGLATVVRRVRRGDGPVAMVMPNAPELTVSAFATWSLGAQAAFLNPAYTTRELRPLIEAARPSLVVAFPDHDEVPALLAAELDVPFLVVGRDDVALGRWTGAGDLDLAAFERPDDADLATLMFTGGTTGTPKGVNHTHRSLMMTVQGMEACWPTAVGTEVWLNVAPMFHIWGLLMGMLNPVYGSATVVVAPRFDPAEIVAAFEEHAVTVFSGGPAEIYAALLAAPGFATSDLSRLRVCPGGGSRFAPSLLDRWFAATGSHIHEAFGMTEVAPISCNPWGRPPRSGSVGVAAPLIELAIVDLADASPLPQGHVGEIAVRAPHLTIGYHGSPESDQHTREGWFLTGDIGSLDADGYLSILDRKKDMLLVGGYNVYPREIDEILMSHPDVLQAATVGVPDPRKGERPVSYVVRSSAASVDNDDLMAHCADNLVPYKRPLEVVTLPALPRTPANKIDRRALVASWTSDPVTAPEPAGS